MTEKAIFEFDAPKSCAECKLNTNPLGIIQNCIGAMEHAFKVDLKDYVNERAPFCPLKMIRSQPLPALKNHQWRG